MKRVARFLLGGALLLFLAVLAAGFFLLNSEQALRWAFAKFSPAGLSVKSLSGTLIGPIRMKGVSYTSKGMNIKVGALAIGWRPVELLRFNVHISSIDASGIWVEAAKEPAHAPAVKKSLPEVSLPSFLSFEVDNFRAENITYIPPAPGQKTLALSLIRLGASMQDSMLHIRSLEVNAPQYSFLVQGKIKTAGDYPFSLKTKWAFTPGDYPRAEGAGSIEGALDRVRILQTVSKPYNANIDLILTGLPGEPGWDGSISWHSLQWPFAGQPQAESPQGRIISKGSPGAYRMSIDAQVRLKGNVPPLRIIAEGAGNMEGISIESLGTALFGGQLLASGKIDWKPGLSWAVAVSGTGLNPAGVYPKWNGNVNFEARTSGSIAGKKREISLEIMHLNGALFGGQLHGSGKINWKPGLSWAVAVSGTGLNPAGVYPEWNGNVNFEARTSGSIAGKKREISLEIMHLDGSLRGYPLKGSGRVLIKDNNYFIPGISIRSGTATLWARGTLLPRWDLSWDINAKNLGELLPDAGGSLHGSGTLRGNNKRPVVNARINGRDAHYKDYKTGTFESSFTIDLSDRASSAISLHATGVQAQGRQIRRFQAGAEGKLASHRVSLSAQMSSGAVLMAMKGGYAGGLWNGTLSRMSVSVQGYGGWDLIHPAPLKVSKELAFTDACLSNGTAQICLKADWQKPAGVRARLSALGIPLGLFTPFFPPGLLVSGSITGNADIYYPRQGAFTGSADITFLNGSLDYSLAGQETRFSFRQSRLKMETANQRATISFDMPFIEGGGIRSQFEIPVPRQGEISGIKGYIRMDIPDIGIFAAALPALRKPRGVLEADFEFSGSLRSPEINGTFSVEKASAMLPALGITLTEVSLKAASAGKDRYHIEGSLRSGGGAISINGDMARTPAGISAVLNLKGENFQAINTGEAKITASPDLSVALRGREIHIGGEVTIPEGNIKPVEISGAVKPSADVVIITETGTKVRTAQWKMYTDVKAILGEKITFSGFGLTSRIAGTIAVRETPGKTATAQGELVIKQGQYKAYGQNLDIQNGKLLFSGGPVDNPGLAIKATRNVNYITVGLNISGTLQSPKLAIFSDPAMDQSDALSYLLFGKPLASDSSSQGNMLYGAATSLGIAGGQAIAKKIGKYFGIEQVSVEKTFTGKTPEQQQEQETVFLGRYLSPRIYVAYGVGILTPENVFRVRYELTKEWMVQAETGTESGADVLYKLEWK